MSQQTFYEALGKSNWNHIGMASIFCAGLLLLFIDKVPKTLSEHLLPALIVFGLGFILIGYIEGSIYRKQFNREGDEKRKHPYMLFFTLNSAWFLNFIIYLFWRNVL